MTADLVTRMAIPGLPDWSGLVVLLLLLLFALAFLLMPFSVFGLKGRLEAIEAQLDEVQAEVRALAMRGAETQRRRPVEEAWDDSAPVRAPREERAPRVVAPIPPPPAVAGNRNTRQEPRLAPRPPLGRG